MGLMGYLYIGIIGANCLLTFLPLLFGGKKISHWAFSLTVLAISWWMLCIYQTSLGLSNILFWERGLLLAQVLLPASLLVFLLHYPRHFCRLSWHWFLLFLPPLALIPLIRHPAVLQADFTAVALHHGPLYALFLGYFLIYTAAGIFVMIRGLSRYHGLDRLKFQYIFYSLCISLGLIFLCSVILPLFGISEFVRLGPLFSSVFIFTTIFSLLKYRLMNLRVLLRKSAFYGLLILVLSVLMTVLIFVAGKLLETTFGLNQLLTTILASTISVILLQLLRKWLDHITHRLFRKKGQGYYKTLSEVGDSLSHIMDMGGIFDTLGNALPRAMAVANAAVYARADSGDFILKSSLNEGPESLLSPHTAVISRLQKTGHALLKEEIEYHYDRCSDAAKRTSYKHILQNLEGLNAVAGFPVICRGRIEAVLFLGEKLSGEVYTDRDMSLLETIAQQAATALQNAKHHTSLHYHIRELERRYELSKSIGRTLNPAEMLTRISALLVELFPFERVVMLSPNDQDQFDSEAYGVMVSFEPGSELKSAMVDGLILISSELDIVRYPEAATLAKFVEALFPGHSFFLVPFSSYSDLNALAIGICTKSDLESVNRTFLATLALDISATLNHGILYDQVLTMRDSLQEVLESMGSGVIVLDSSLRLLKLNMRAREILGIKNSETMLNQDIRELAPFQRYVSSFEGTLESGHCVNQEVKIENGLQTTYYSLSIGILHRLPSEKGGLIAVFSDITPVKELQLQIEQSNRLSSLGVMAAGIAHEIKNPLTSLKLYVQSVIANWEDIDFRDRFIQTVPHQLNRIDKLSQSLLKLGKSQSLELGELPLNAVFDELLLLLEGERKMYNARILTEFADNYVVVIDKDQILQVMLNLTLNALQALPEKGGELTLRTRLIPHNGYVEICVCDNGVGIPKAFLPRLFDPFFTTKKKGTGLGLSLVYKMIEYHRGKIMVESEEGQGTTFKLYLPTPKAVAEKL